PPGRRSGRGGPAAAGRVAAGAAHRGRRGQRALGGLGGPLAGRGARTALLPRRGAGLHHGRPLAPGPEPGAAAPPAAPLSIDQVEALTEAAGRPGTGRDSTARALRDRALLEVLYGLGARISEATGLDVDDIATQERAAVLRGKGDKHRVV